MVTLTEKLLNVFNIQPQLYLIVYYHFLLVIVLVTIFRLISGKYKPQSKPVGFFLFSFLILIIIGLRPFNIPGVGRYFGDTVNYYNIFQQFASGNYERKIYDPAFYLLTRVCSNVMSGQLYFLTLAALYILPLYVAVRRLSQDYSFLLFLMILTSFLFWANGVNGIRIGIATSLLLLAFTFRDKKWLLFLLMALSVTFHKSAILPAGAFVLGLFYRDSRGYIAFWFASIVLSLLFGGFWESFFASFNVGDERFSSYLTAEVNSEVFRHIGFRWDFLLYSFVPVVLGAYYIFRRGYSSEFYINLFNTYLLANSFWILVIRSSFSNRFASLSWFILPIIIILPLLKEDVWSKQWSKVSMILFLNFAFTYFMQINLLWK